MLKRAWEQASQFAPFRQDLPSPMELEQAIAHVEDVVMPLARLLPPGTRLVRADAVARRVQAALGITGPVPLADVERLFNELAAVALGRPAASAGVPVDAEFFCYVLVLREFMHHLGFGSLDVE